MKVIVIGGGLAGLTSAICLAEKGIEVTVIEKESYPFHKVCGEYVSNEVKPFLLKRKHLPPDISIPEIKTLDVISLKGTSFQSKLEKGGFGISRYILDNYLFNHAKERGVKFLTGKYVDDVSFDGNTFEVLIRGGEILDAGLVIGSFGKRSVLDRNLNRKSFTKSSPFMAVKYHVKTDLPRNLIRLMLFDGGYCGISAVEDNKYCLCYLVKRDVLKRHGSIESMESEHLSNNAALKHVFQNSEWLYQKPLVINEISFSNKELIVDHVLMAGDSAGMIVPLCGNGMSMAIRSGRDLAGFVSQFASGKINRNKLEQEYTNHWRKSFSIRLQIGRTLQSLVFNPLMTEFTVRILNKSPWLSKKLIGYSHGPNFE